MQMFIIPTNSKLEKSLESIIKEIEYSSKKNKMLVILDNGEEDIYEYNEIRIHTLSEGVSFKINHVGIVFMKQLIMELSVFLTIDYQILEKLLLPKTGDYGAISNMIYLLGLFYEADTIHRRDSDCYVLFDDPTTFPIVEEEFYLGKPLNSVLDKLEIKESSDIDLADEVLMVGSDYYGDFNMDWSLLENPDRERNDAIEKIFALMGVPEDAIAQQISSKYKKEVSTKRLPLLKTGFNVSEYPDCGNVSMKEIYKYIPNFIGIKGIGYDYNTYFFSFLFKVPIVYHFNKINHEHDHSRKELDNQVKYWVGVYKQICLDNLLTEFIQVHLKDLLLSSMNIGIKLVQELISNGKFINSLQKSADEIHEENQYVIKELIELLIQVGTPESEYVSNYFKDNEDALTMSINNDFNESILLISIWKSIISFFEN